MKRRGLKIISLALCLSTLLTACGGDHVHTFSEEWETTQTHHYHPATCEHGEERDSYGEHLDVDENGLCDECAYEVGHTHKFEGEWIFDEENHWKQATCTHVGEIGEKALHIDEDTNGECDVCDAHVHIINTFGFCLGCDKETKPVEEDVLGSVVYATSARKKHIIGGSLSYLFEGENKTENTIDTMEHDVSYKLGTNGTYMNRSYVNLSGNSETLEYHIKAEANGDATGITVLKENGAIIDAQPSSFDGTSLLGYYYAVSTLAYGHGAENVLKSLYEQSQDENCVKEFNSTSDVENNKHSFDFKTLVVHKTKIAQGDKEGEYVYNVNYFVVKVEFTYNDDYALTSLSIECECYTNDPGSSFEGLLEADVDLDYNPDDDTFSLRDNAGVDKYTITVTQTTGQRQEIQLDDGSSYAPQSFDVKYDGNAVTDLTLDVGENVQLNIIGSPENSYMSFIKNLLVLDIKDSEGNDADGLSVLLHGFDELQLYPSLAGEYVITLSYGETIKTINVVVTGLELGGEYTFTYLSTDNNAWTQPYDFKATATGEYTFYLPYGVGAATYTTLDQYDDPYIEAKNILFDYDDDVMNKEGSATFTVTLRKGQTLKLCFKFRDKNTTYTIGYDQPAPQA